MKARGWATAVVLRWCVVELSFIHLTNFLGALYGRQGGKGGGWIGHSGGRTDAVFALLELKCFEQCRLVG